MSAETRVADLVLPQQAVVKWYVGKHWVQATTTLETCKYSLSEHRVNKYHASHHSAERLM